MGLRGGESLSGGAKMRSWFVGFAIGGQREMEKDGEKEKEKEKCLTKKMGICAFERWEAIFLMGTCVSEQ